MSDSESNLCDGELFQLDYSQSVLLCKGSRIFANSSTADIHDQASFSDPVLRSTMRPHLDIVTVANVIFGLRGESGTEEIEGEKKK